MAPILQPHECLVYDGEAALRAPDGTPLENVPQYIIATVTDPALEVPVASDETLVLVGVRTRKGQKQAALERYEEALRRGKKPLPTENSTETLYIKVPTSEIGQLQRLTKSEELACRYILATVLERYDKLIWDLVVAEQNRLGKWVIGDDYADDIVSCTI